MSITTKITKFVNGEMRVLTREDGTYKVVANGQVHEFEDRQSAYSKLNERQDNGNIRQEGTERRDASTEEKGNEKEASEQEASGEENQGQKGDSSNPESSRKTGSSSESESEPKAKKRKGKKIS